MTSESAVSVVLSFLILFTLFATLASVVLSDAADWEAVHSCESVSRIYGILENRPNLSIVSSIAAANADFTQRLSRSGNSRSRMVYGEVDDYGFLKLHFRYSHVMKGISPDGSIILPAGGVHMSDGVDFSEEMVFITRTGEKYHKGDCFHLRKSKFGIDLKEAEQKGYTPCKNCHKGE